MLSPLLARLAHSSCSLDSLWRGQALAGACSRGGLSRAPSRGGAGAACCCWTGRGLGSASGPTATPSPTPPTPTPSPRRSAPVTRDPISSVAASFWNHRRESA
eukprot:125191-Prorocentrum_minimum.AAC.1